MSRRPCLVCGEPTTDGSYCDEHQPQPWQQPKGNARQRGYDTAWTKLSKRARKLQPFCSDCGATTGLTCDHLPSAWRRKAQNKPLRLSDVDVVCGPCNVARGSSRPGSERSQTQGTGPSEGSRYRGAKPQSPSLLTSRDLPGSDR